MATITAIIRQVIQFFTVINILTVAGFILSLIPLFSNQELQHDISIIVLGIYIFILSALFVWREIVFSRKARFAESSKNLHEAAHAIRDAHNSIDKNDREQTMTNIIMALDSLSTSFSLITGATCRVCIKTILCKTNSGKQQENIFYTETFTRSGALFSENTNKKEPALISENTDFDIILNHGKRYYLCNNLIKENGYRNSNWPSTPEKLKEFFKKREYDYISTMVLPIRLNARDKDKCIGFLCIDSNTRNIFEPRYDIDHAAVIADTLFPLLLRFRGNKSFHSKNEPVTPTTVIETVATDKTVKPNRPKRRSC